MTQIKLRRDTAANFTSKNPVLEIGEPAYETDTKKLKIGDGTTAYNNLDYFAGGGGLEVKIATTADFNSPKLLETGLYYISGGLNPQNAPVIYSVAAMLITMKWFSESSNQCIQQTWIGCEDLVGNQIYTRYSSSDGTMGSWTRVDSNKIASSSALGSIKVGDGLTISSDGTLSASGGSSSGDVFSSGNNTFTGINTFKKDIILDERAYEPQIKVSYTNDSGAVTTSPIIAPSNLGLGGSFAHLDIGLKDIRTYIYGNPITLKGSVTTEGALTIANTGTGQVNKLSLAALSGSATAITLYNGLQIYTDIDTYTSILRVGDTNIPTIIQGSTIKDNNNAEFVRLVESHIDETGGYRLYSDGYCEQWGDSTGVATTSITFLKPYKNTSYTVLATSGYPNDNPVYNSFLPHEKTTTGFSVKWIDTLRYNMWRAFGYVGI